MKMIKITNYMIILLKRRLCCFYKNKRIGEEFKYNGLKADDTLTETTDFKYVDNIFDKNKKELHVYEIDLPSSSDDDAMFDKLSSDIRNKKFNKRV